MAIDPQHLTIRHVMRRILWILLLLGSTCLALTDKDLRGKEEEESDGYRLPSLDLCLQEEVYNCGEETGCVPSEAQCDGIADCTNGADESVHLCGCLDYEFECNGTCIDLIHRCDTRPDCPDLSDEMDCETYQCPSTHVKCDNHFCVPKESVCNFRDDCGDGSDEQKCHLRKCWFGEYTCNNSECVRTMYVCDGQRDCADGSDESQCDVKEHFVQCGDGRLSHVSQWCDGWPDCQDNHADELNCRECFVHEFRCRNSRCISRANVCDSKCDCVGTCEDEENCFRKYKKQDGVALCNNSTTFHCPHSHRCVATEFICDGRNDCLWGSTGADEFHCGEEKRKCVTEGNVPCSDGRCLPKALKCNSVQDCLEGEDENGCAAVSCNQTEFRCLSGQCIPKGYRCDLFFNCRDKSDELDCWSEEGCQEGYKRCRTGQCIPESWWCDFRYDCPDESDESDCGMLPEVCSEDEFRCSNGQCIPGSLRCHHTRDHRIGCADQSHLRGCEQWSCQEGYMKCDNSYCVHNSLICDGNIDCLHSWTDEDGCPFKCEKGKLCSCVDVTMNCTGKQLTEIPQEIEPAISKLILQRNKLGPVLKKGMFSNLERTIELDLSYNFITVIEPGTFQDLWRLRILDLTNNNFTVLFSEGFSGLPSLRSLLLKGNSIQRLKPLAFSGLSSLKDLDLSHQQLVNISKKAFLGLRSLIILDLSFNKLQYVHDGIFYGLTNLASLDLSNNGLAVIGVKALQGLSRLQKLRTDEFRFCCLAPTIPDCLPEPDEFSSCEDLMSNFVLRVCIWVLGVIALTGNILVILWRAAYKTEKKVHSFLITNLAIGDLLMGGYLLMIASVDNYYRGVYFNFDAMWRQSRLCQLAGFISTLSSELSVFTLTVITIERFVSIIFPFRMKRLEMKETRVIMAAIWLAVLLLAGVPLLEVDYFSNYYGRSGVCLSLHITPDRPSGWEYSVFVFLAMNFVCFTIIAVAYFWMFLVARETQRAVRTPDNRGDGKMARRMAMIVLTDFCCWMPIILLGISSLQGAIIPQQVYAWVAVFVLPLNAAVNPLLYTLSTAPFLGPARKRVTRLRISFMTSGNGDTQKSVIVSLPDVKAKEDWSSMSSGDNKDTVYLREVPSPKQGNNCYTYNGDTIASRRNRLSPDSRDRNENLRNSINSRKELLD